MGAVLILKLPFYILSRDSNDYPSNGLKEAVDYLSTICSSEGYFEIYIIYSGTDS